MSMIGSLPAQAANPPPVTVTYTVTTQAPTCNLGLDPSTPSPVTLPSLARSAFSVANGTPTQTGMPIKLKLTGCVGLGGSQLPKIRVWGDSIGVSPSTKLYRSAASAAAGVGFVLINDATCTGAIMTAGSAATPQVVTVPGGSGTVLPNNLVTSFCTKVSRDTLPFTGMTSGPLTAALHFDFQYQ